MNDEDIKRNLTALEQINVKGSLDMFDGSLLAEI